MIYKGTWLAEDANVHSHSGLSQPTTSHGLVRIDSDGKPVQQVASTTSTLMALHQADGYVYAAADLTPAYKGHAAVQKVHREMIYVKPDVVIVYDRVTTPASAPQTWQLQTPVAATIDGAVSTISTNGHALAIHKIAGGNASVFSHQAADADFTNGGFRYDETMAGGDHRYLHVLGVDGAVASAAAMGNTGVTITLAAGGTVTATFVRDSVGATLTMGGKTVTLGAGVDQLPE
jgi:hypothetical protein